MDEKNASDDAPTPPDGETKTGIGGPPQERIADPADVHSLSTPMNHDVRPSETKATESPSPSQHPNAEMTTMEDAISSGVPENVSGLLDRMDNASAIRQLTGCYGGRGSKFEPHKDDKGLGRMTVPLLHAAYTGNTSMFSTVLGAMEAKLRVQQVKRMVGSMDVYSRSILTMAVSSKSKAMVKAALDTLERHLTRDQVKVMMAYSEHDGNILVYAAASGRKDVFEATRVALQPGLLTKEEVVRLMVYQGGKMARFSSILSAAATSGDKDTWEAILAELKRSEVEVKDMVMAALGEEGGNDPPPMEFEHNLYSVGTTRPVDTGNKAPVLHAAVLSGSVEFFSGIYGFLLGLLVPEEVEKMVSFRGPFGRNIFHSAANSGSKAMFDAVSAVVKGDKVKSMILSSLEGGVEVVVSVLHAAAHSGSKECFEGVLNFLEDKLAPEEVEKVIKSTGHFFFRLDTSIRCVDDYHWTILDSAAYSGSTAVVEAVLATIRKKLGSDEVKTMIMFTGGYRFDSRCILKSAAMSGSKDVFEALLAVPIEDMPSLVRGMMTSFAKGFYGILASSVKSGNMELFQRMIRELEQDSSLDWTEKEVSDLLRTAANIGCVDMWKAVDQDFDMLSSAVSSRDPGIVRSLCGFVRESLRAGEASEALGNYASTGFSSWLEVVGALMPQRLPLLGSEGLAWAIEVLSCLLEYPVVLDPSDIVRLSRTAPEEWLVACFLETTASSVENPFMAGMTLSVTLAKAADEARYGERRTLSSLQNKLDSLLLEVLERLPQTVHGFPECMAGCARVFEPEVQAGHARELRGPLRMMLQNRGQMETFCRQSLVVDFLSYRFTQGLPNLLKAKTVLGYFRYGTMELDSIARGDMLSRTYHGLDDNQRRLEDTRRRDRYLVMDIADNAPKFVFDTFAGKLIDTILLSPGLMLQGVGAISGLEEQPRNLSIFPGVQFLSAGLVAMPDAYYRVPAVRMTLDVIVYLGVLGLFCSVVVFDGGGPRTAGEILLAVYVPAGAIAEIREMRRDFSLYTANHWNPIDLLGLGLVAGGLVFRFADETSSWGRALYALSAPLLFSRVLFFAQTLRFQGPMVQVLFHMLGELVKFGVIIFVVMFGFAISFYALFRDVDSFGVTFLTLFKGMLGEVGFFDDFLGEEYIEYEEVATALFIIYLVVIAVMLLNLLIAVLSTSYALVQEKAEQEFRVSRALLIDHYRLVVDEHLLPPPFNLVQLVLSLFFLADRSKDGERRARAKEAVGKIIFWLVMGPLAVAGGTVVWVLSVVYTPFTWRTWLQNESPFSRATWYLALFMWCILGAPLYLTAFWLTAPLKWIGLQPWGLLWDRRESPKPLETDDTCIDDILKDGPGGLSVDELHEFLEDPMSDPTVRQDEKSRTTPVEHTKQLRDRVEKTITTHIKGVDARLARIEHEVATLHEGIDRKLDAILSK